MRPHACYLYAVATLKPSHQWHEGTSYTYLCFDSWGEHLCVLMVYVHHIAAYPLPLHWNVFALFLFRKLLGSILSLWDINHNQKIPVNNSITHSQTFNRLSIARSSSRKPGLKCHIKSTPVGFLTSFSQNMDTQHCVASPKRLAQKISNRMQHRPCSVLFLWNTPCISSVVYKQIEWPGFFRE